MVVKWAISSLVWLGVSLTVVCHAGTKNSQSVLQVPTMQPNLNDVDRSGLWSLSLSDDWDVLGPFPVHAREQHYLSPSYPLNLSKPIDLAASWPSSYADNGTVGWTKATSQNGNLAVSFPDVRWASLRATEGWAGIQHHSVLRTTITINPPEVTPGNSLVTPNLLVSLIQGSFFTVVPRYSGDLESFTPKWYSGDIYAMGAATPQAVPLPVLPSLLQPTEYDLFVSGDYEIRLFGDPTARHSQVPELSIALAVDLEIPSSTVSLVLSHDVVPYFVDGWSFGDAIGLGVRSDSGWWTVKGVSSSLRSQEALKLELLREVRLAPSQTRIIPLHLSQDGPFNGTEIQLGVTVASESSITTISVRIPIQHRKQWSPSDFSAIKATYFFSESIPTTFLVIPPVHENGPQLKPPILALHGAGVEILDMPFWAEALPRQTHSWVVASTGRTAWGLDWHGPSAQEAWSTVDALHDILESHPLWYPWRTERNTRAIIVGHSNGGQGTWYMASRYPDRTVAAIPAAAYIKSQSYVPLIQSRSAHFIDPALRAILESALTPDDNDLFLTNLVDTPILAIHGGNDDNVPVWHTRELVSTLKTWYPDANVVFQEDPGQPHWYSSLFRNPTVQRFLDTILGGSQDNAQCASSFTLTVAVPHESGSLRGIRVEVLKTPGRLGRLHVHSAGGTTYIKTTNVIAFSIARNSSVIVGQQVVVDGERQLLTRTVGDHPAVQFSKGQGHWEVASSASTVERTMSTSGRLSNILTSSGPLTIVLPDEPKALLLAAATRIAHDLNLYHKLDTDILYASEAMAKLKDKSLGVGNIVTIGGQFNDFTTSLLQRKRTPFRIADGHLSLNEEPLDEGLAAIFLHPHPLDDASLALVIHSETDSGLERALRLFPIRTGVPVPDWVIVGETADVMGAGGVQGAGVWGYQWSWNEALSSF